MEAFVAGELQAALRHGSIGGRCADGERTQKAQHSPIKHYT